MSVASSRQRKFISKRLNRALYEILKAASHSVEIIELENTAVRRGHSISSAGKNLYVLAENEESDFVIDEYPSYKLVDHNQLPTFNDVNRGVQYPRAAAKFLLGKDRYVDLREIIQGVRDSRLYTFPVSFPEYWMYSYLNKYKEFFSRSGELKIGLKEWRSTVNKNHSQMNFWIFSVTAHKGHDYALAAEEIYRQRMQDGFWGLNENNVNFKSLCEGDNVIFYVGRPNSFFVGTATLASPGFQLTEEEKVRLSHGISFYSVNTGVLLRNIDVWEDSIPILNLLSRLSFIKNKDKWYAYFQGGVIRISEHDYQAISGDKDEMPNTGIDWSDEEVRGTVESYFHMLIKELAGEQYNKSAYRNDLLTKIKRTKGSVEFKYQNISSALAAKGLPYIEGYKPRGNYQKLLEEAIDNYIGAHPEILNLIRQNIEIVPAKDLESINYDEVLEDAPESDEKGEGILDKKRSYQAKKYNFTNREAENKKLGDKGEEFVVLFERRRLLKAGRPDLAERVERISETLGDGAGYDIHSFEEDGANRLIEVKTTNLAKSYPFYISANELDFSEDYPAQYYLYRVFNFKKSPKLYILQGSLKGKVIITPAVFKVSF